MSVKTILKQFGQKVGLNPSATSSREVLLRYLNEAANELWFECDITGSLMEQVFKINGDQTVTMPMEVGAVRAVRDYNSRQAVSINQMRPRYNEFNWKDAWYNYRLKNTQALQVTVTNQSELVLTVPFVENPPITVSLSGPTDYANSATENVLMDEAKKLTFTAFNDVTAAVKDRVNSCNVTISDVDGNQLTMIPNNRLDARYQILDISAAPWLTTTSNPLSNYVEILYKKALPYLSNDNDEFPAAGYDYQLVDKCLQLYYQEQGKADLAVAYDAKATRGLARKKNDQNKSTEDVVAFVQHPHDSIIPKIRGNRVTTWGWRRRV